MNTDFGYKILIIDDNPEILSQVSDAFATELQTYDVKKANSFNSGLLAAEELPDVIILDLELENNRGYELLKALKEGEYTYDIPIIVLTSSNEIERAFQAGAVDFIRKPLDETELTIRVKSSLSLFKLIKGILKQTEELEIQSENLERQKREIEIEKQKSDTLLLNILPYEIAEQLKNKGTVDAKTYRTTSILFTDFKDFTKLSETLSPEDLIEELGVYFEKFDDISGRHFIEKIKTIGDAYMCVGGLPLRNKSNPIDTVFAGLEIQKFMSEYGEIRNSKNLTVWEVRIGIHTGRVIAGVIGTRKFAYDIWGDAVNTAARIETACEPGKVNISGETYKHIKEYFECSYRGKIAAKNKGEIDMYYVHGLKPEYREENDPIKPNEKFKQILATY